YLAQIRLEGCRQSYRGQIRRATTKRSDIPRFVDALVSGDDHDPIAAQRRDEPFAFDRFEFCAAVLGIRREFKLMREEGDARMAQSLKTNREQCGGNLLSGRDE